MLARVFVLSLRVRTGSRCSYSLASGSACRWVVHSYNGPLSNCTYSNNGHLLITESTSRTCQLTKSETFNDLSRGRTTLDCQFCMATYSPFQPHRCMTAANRNRNPLTGPTHTISRHREKYQTVLYSRLRFHDTRQDGCH